jgi:hypothetical protein
MHILYLRMSYNDSRNKTDVLNRNVYSVDQIMTNEMRGYVARWGRGDVHIEFRLVNL